MPKVSEQYREGRRQHILAAARRCFLRNGFHATSMDDLLAEAGLSTGALYRYFAGKDDIIAAIAEDNLSRVVAATRQLAAAESDEGPGAAIAVALDLVRAGQAEDGLGTMALMVWSEALRNAALAERLTAALREARAAVADLVRHHQELGKLPAGPSADAVAALAVSVVPGFILQLALLGHDAVDGVPEALRAVLP